MDVRRRTLDVLGGAALLALLPVACGDDATEKREADAAPPIVVDYQPVPDQSQYQLYRLARGAPVDVTLPLRLTGSGALFLRGDGGAWEPTTLLRFADDLDRATRRAVEERRAGTSSDRNGPHFREGRSPIVVGIEADPDARWQHVLWISTVCEGRAVDKVLLRVGDRELFLFLPWDAAIEWIEGREPKIASIPVGVDSRGAEPSYLFAKSHVRTPADLAARLAAAWNERKVILPKHTFAPVIFAESSTRLATMLDIFEAMLAEGLPRLSFWYIPSLDESDVPRYPFRRCTSIPRRKTLGASTLPAHD